jgi:1-acyl-sn-glycerol-3-phosphate acyltransferase
MDGPRIITDAGAAARGLGSRTDLPPSAFDPPTGRWTRTARTTTGWAMRLAEALIGGRIRVTGLEDLDDGPLLFVANHFTRFETFILPYLIYLRTGRFVHSLAWHGLFRGLFGRYLLAMGARPTRDPAIRHRMVEDLMTGAHDWLIYPEGGMVKDKHLWKDGHLDLDLPDRHGPPHTGAAIMALKALFYRDGFLRAVAAGDRGLQARYQERYHLAGAGTVSTVPLRVVPVTITYWPLRPEANGLTWLARRLMKEVPAQLREELTVEGHLLLHRTDIAVHIEIGRAHV